ncbi:MAG: hypothetical protein HQK76_00090 [Desulfobacterales bacterium]|nr:hypothetical protein [Desulfobacterales bacterium]
MKMLLLFISVCFIFSNAAAVDTLESAKFHEESIGDYEAALKYYESTLDKKNIERILALKKKFQEQDNSLNMFRSEIGKDLSKYETETIINQLQDLLKNYPEYYRLFEVFYTIGIGYMRIDEYKSAYKSFNEALKLKPACHLFLPILLNIENAHKKWVRYIIKSITWIVLFFLSFTTLILFYFAQPWCWIKRKHIVLGLFFILFWTVIFFIVFYYFGNKIELIEKKAMEQNPKNIITVYATPFSAGSEIAAILFIYGLIGILGIYLFVIGTTLIKNKELRSVTNYLFAWIIFTALLVHFYIYYCDGICEFEPYSTNVLHYYRGSLSFTLNL